MCVLEIPPHKMVPEFPPNAAAFVRHASMFCPSRFKRPDSRIDSSFSSANFCIRAHPGERLSDMARRFGQQDRLRKSAVVEPAAEVHARLISMTGTQPDPGRSRQASTVGAPARSFLFLAARLLAAPHSLVARRGLSRPTFDLMTVPCVPFRPGRRRPRPSACRCIGSMSRQHCRLSWHRTREACAGRSPQDARRRLLARQVGNFLLAFLGDTVKIPNHEAHRNPHQWW